MNHDDLLKKGFRPDGRGGWAKAPAPLAAPIPDAKPQPHAGPALAAPAQDEKRRGPRLVVRVTRRARRLLDVDNGSGGCKPLLDAIRYRGLIRDDNPHEIDFQFRQERVGTRSEEGTLIEIF
ncbi:MAG: hypothetical protein PW734_06790 [Verrucomicrobium sp.]|nr:hypothetical protein [Verrucomicrobium sp.]